VKLRPTTVRFATAAREFRKVRNDADVELTTSVF